MEDQISKSEDVIVMKNCLLCMELIEETVPEELVHWFIDLDTDQVIEHWLLYLNQYDYMVRKDIPQAIIDKSHQDFTKSLKSAMWLSSTKEMQGGILRPEMPLSMMSRVELGLKNMQRKVLDDPGCSLDELIELAEPSIIQVYQQVRSDHALDIEKAFTAIENGQYNRQVIDTPDRQLMYRASVATAMQYASALGQIADKEEERILAVDAIEGCLELRKWQQFYNATRI